MAVDRSLELLNPPAPPEDLAEWFLSRVQREPWALGGVLVMALFILGTLSLIVFALVYGCCCDASSLSPRRPKAKHPANEVI